MDIFESLENLAVSEECFNDILGIVEQLLSEESKALWGATLGDKYINKKLGGESPKPWSKEAEKVEHLNDIQYRNLPAQEKDRFIEGFKEASIQSPEQDKKYGHGKTRAESGGVLANPDYQKTKRTATKALKGHSKESLKSLLVDGEKYIDPKKLYKLGKAVEKRKNK